MADLVEINNSVIADWQSDPELLRLIPCVRLPKPAGKRPCSLCKHREAAQAEQGYKDAMQCLRGLNKTQGEYLKTKLNTLQIRFTVLRKNGKSDRVTLRL